MRQPPQPGSDKARAPRTCRRGKQKWQRRGMGGRQRSGGCKKKKEGGGRRPDGQRREREKMRARELDERETE